MCKVQRERTMRAKQKIHKQTAAPKHPKASCFDPHLCQSHNPRSSPTTPVSDQQEKSCDTLYPTWSPLHTRHHARTVHEHMHRTTASHSLRQLEEGFCGFNCPEADTHHLTRIWHLSVFYVSSALIITYLFTHNTGPIITAHEISCNLDLII